LTSCKWRKGRKIRKKKKAENLFFLVLLSLPRRSLSSRGSLATIYLFCVRLFFCFQDKIHVR
jgi:hypothetical protein